MGSLVGERVLIEGKLRGPHKVSWGEDGMIVSIEECAREEAIKGSVLCPGFISLQVNGVDEVDVREAKGEQWWRLSELLLQQGVTSWYPTVVSEALADYQPVFEEVTRAMSKQVLGQCDLMGLHIEGPFLGVAGAHRPGLLSGADIEWVKNIPEKCVRIMTVAAEQKNVIECTRLLKEKGIVVSIGHSKANEKEVEAFVSAGGTLVTHLFNAMSGVHHRTDGLALTTLTTDELYADIIVDLQHVSARAVELAFRAKPEKMILVTDSISHLSSFTQKYYQGSNIPFAIKGGAPHLTDGTLAGATVRMPECIKNCVQHAKVALEVALSAASWVPACVMNLKDRGALVQGFRADLVLLDSSFEIIETVCQGVSHAGASQFRASKRAKI